MVSTRPDRQPPNASPADHAADAGDPYTEAARERLRIVGKGSWRKGKQELVVLATRRLQFQRIDSKTTASSGKTRSRRQRPCLDLGSHARCPQELTEIACEAIGQIDASLRLAKSREAKPGLEPRLRNMTKRALAPIGREPPHRSQTQYSGHEEGVPHSETRSAKGAGSAVAASERTPFWPNDESSRSA